jgi:competence protein ComEA
MNTSQPNPPAAPDPAEILARGININTASQAEIEALPGVGPTLAARIVEARPFTNPADLDRIKGIGPKMIEKITPYLRF